MKNTTSHGGQARAGAQTPGLAVVPTLSESPAGKSARMGQAAQPLSALDGGIVVSEEELGTVKAQRLYKMRCECGRSWFELELPTLVECPACKTLGLVSA